MDSSMGFEVDGNNYYSMVEMAKAAGVTRQTLYRWIEEGKVNGPGYERRRDGRRFFSKAEREAVLAFALGVEPVGDPNQLNLSFEKEGKTR